MSLLRLKILILTCKFWLWNLHICLWSAWFVSSIKSLMQLKILHEGMLKIWLHNLATKVWGDFRTMLQIPHLINVLCFTTCRILH